MRAAIVALVTIVALLSTVLAQSRKIMVLPLSGDAPAAQRTKLNETIAQLAKDKGGGDVTVGDTTFEETAAAVGCDPTQPACAETVRTTLQVDELVYGSAKTADGSTTVIVTRTSANGEPKSKISVISETDSGEGATESLGGLYAEEGSGSGSGSGSAGRAPVGGNFFDTKERKIGVAVGAGGVLAVVIGLVFWNSASNKQDQIDAHPTANLSDINDLKSLEDEAASKALLGNIFFFAGVAAVAVGGYFLWKDHKNRSAVVAPAPAENGTGMTLVLGGRW
jgi:hypothetical protein